MANLRVNVYKYVRVSDRWKYCKPLVAANGRIKPDWVLVGGQPERHPEGNFYLQYLEPGKKLVWKKVGADASMAVKAAERKAAELSARANGLVVGVAPSQQSIPEPQCSPRIPDAVDKYLEEVRLKHHFETWQLAAQSVNEFVALLPKDITNLHHIEKRHLLLYADWCKQKLGNRPRTCHNKFLRALQFMKYHGYKIASRRDAPRFTDRPPEVYDPEQLQKFFSACRGVQMVIFQTFLMCGLRMKELATLRKQDVDFRHGLIKVVERPEYKFHPKAHHAREIPVPVELLAKLKEVVQASSSPLVFPTKNGKVNTKLLQCCKRIAKRAGMPDSDWWLHRFRATYCTTLLRRGVDIETCRFLMGHVDNESIARYLVPLKGQALREKVNSVWQ